MQTLPARSHWLPNFDSARALLALVIGAELVAIVSILAPVGGSGGFWLKIGPASLLAQVIALLCGIGLNLAHPSLAKCKPMVAAFGALGVIAFSTFVCAQFGALFIDYLYYVEGQQPTRAFAWRMLALVLLVSAAALRYLYVQHQWVEQVQVNAQAKVEALTARIRPHFLFNSMNTVASLIAIDPERAEKMVEDLAALFRAAFRAGDKPIALEQELDLARQYLEIEQTRLGDRLGYEFQIDRNCLAIQLPPLLLQPLVENAVYHGIQRLPEGGVVSVIAKLDGARLLISVQNPVPSSDTQPGNQMAHHNIRERLQLAFGGKAQMQVNMDQRHYLVTLVLPAKGSL
jgi:two-component system, LytTR family, sensor histidine kinase AlgZ